MGALAWIEVLHRDGTVRHAQKVDAWPLRAGRGLDNELVLDDLHTAAHHFTVDADDQGDGAVVTAMPSRNGLQVGHQHLQQGERWASGNEPFDIIAGRTIVRVRLANHAVTPELPLLQTLALKSHWLLALSVFLLALLAVVQRVCVAVENDELATELTSTALYGGLMGLAWCSAWALLSKLFNHRSHFLWHVQVMSLLALVAVALEAVVVVLAFSLSLAWASDFLFVPLLLLAATGLYFHLLAVESHRPRMLRMLVVAVALGSVGFVSWRHWQKSGQLGSEPFMSRMMPPRYLLVEPLDTETFVQQSEGLKKRLDRMAIGTPDTEEANDSQGADGGAGKEDDTGDGKDGGNDAGKERGKEAGNEGAKKDGEPS